jgi:hypothetical protein
MDAHNPTALSYANESALGCSHSRRRMAAAEHPEGWPHRRSDERLNLRQRGMVERIRGTMFWIWLSWGVEALNSVEVALVGTRDGAHLSK